jgi:hypothetical protein
MMFELNEKGMQGSSFGGTDETTIEPGAFEHKEYHDKSAKEIEGE